MKKRILTTMILILAATTIEACSWAGKTTGKAVNVVEKGAGEFEKAYKQERSAEDATPQAE
ncbi:MAG: hypothetical protein GVY22_13615 [Gammaproteobacteria bacterium]|jgi:predicted small secreted protein|nr:hypothetical protein [Gammaproteobacteria bacterium]